VNYPIIAAVFCAIIFTAADGSPTLYEITGSALRVQVPAGGGCPERIYAADVTATGEEQIVVLKKTRSDPCKGWFPGEFRWIEFPLADLKLKAGSATKVVIEK
jgi:hypothetical protein